jgi:hypothetical protein
MLQMKHHTKLTYVLLLSVATVHPTTYMRLLVYHDCAAHD